MSATIESTPRADGFRMPGEFEPHDGCWMLWPERRDNWRLEAGPAQEAFAAVAAAIAASEPVTVGASSEQVEHAGALLPSSVRVVELPSDDAWVRDTGPTFVVDNGGERRGVDWGFNAWGGIYSPWERDEEVAARVLAIEGAERYRAPLVLEGGSVHVDGEGTVLTTEECLLNPNRNPGLSRDQIERALLDYLGAEKVVWLGRGVFEDETDGHVDNLACFARPGVVLLSWSGDESDPQGAISRDALARLEAATDARGRPFEVVRLPSPGPLTMTTEEAAGVEAHKGTLPRRAGDRLAASYANFYLGNTRVVVPLLDQRHDDEALEILRGCFPERAVVGVPGREILLGGGNVHCITQQVPAATSAGARQAATRASESA
ncbi:MAG TPA: agmatine deiminase [Solirubrobacterales bacterium]|nr:agmatine deiminase [Solirubrobacterales bacterium]